MRIGSAVVILGWGAVLALWLLLLITAPLGQPRLVDWLIVLVPLSGIGVTYLAVLFWRRDRRFIGGVGLGASIIGLLWMMTGMLNVIAVLGGTAPS